MIDSVISNIVSIFTSLNQHFDFLYDINKFKKKSKILNTEKLSGFMLSPANRWEQWLPTAWVVWRVTKHDPKFT